MSDSRRQFLYRAGLATAALRVATANPLQKPIGLQLYTVSDELAHDFNGAIQKIAAIGYKEVELAPTYGKTAAEWKTVFKDNGLNCRSVHMFDFNQTPQHFMDFAQQLGAKYVVTSLNPPPAIAAKLTSANPDWTSLVTAVEGMNLDDWKKSADVANNLGDEANKRGLVYAYHNHNVEFKKFGGTTAFETLLASTNPDTVKFEMDCGWVSAAGYDPILFLKKYPERIRMLHIKAFKAASPTLVLVGDNKPTPAELGHGKPDYKAIFAAAAKANIEQYYVEQEPPFTDMTALEADKVDYDYLHALNA